MNNIDQLWKMYEESVWKEMDLERRNEENALNTIYKCSQNGITNGILRCIEVLENNNIDVWRKSFNIFCKAKGINTDTGFGFWIPVSERQPEEDGTYYCTIDGEICGLDKPYSDICGFENGKWDEEGYVLAWMPRPEPFEC